MKYFKDLMLFFIAIGIWGIFFQNMGLIPLANDDLTQKVEVVNTVDVYGSVRVDGGYISTEVDGIVDINLNAITGRRPWVGTRGNSAVLGVFAEDSRLGK